MTEINKTETCKGEASAQNNCQDPKYFFRVATFPNFAPCFQPSWPNTKTKEARENKVYAKATLRIKRIYY